MKHIAKLRKRNERWKILNSQSVQDICQRIDRAYKRFFQDKRSGSPGYKKKVKYKSFTLKQTGYKLFENNRIKIGKKVYKYWKSREIQGKVKTVTVKRNALGQMFIYVVTDHVDKISAPRTGKIAGWDFGLKTFLTGSNEVAVKSPEFLKKFLSLLQQRSKQHSRKKGGSRNRELARKKLAKVHLKITNSRKDWFWKISHHLTDLYDYLFFETLNLQGMKKLWGRKVSDLSFATFLNILQCVAQKKDKTVAFVDPWYPSTKTCNSCNTVAKQKIPLEVRRWRCGCGVVNDRDLNAAKNICREGASSLNLDTVRLLSVASVV